MDKLQHIRGRAMVLVLLLAVALGLVGGHQTNPSQDASMQAFALAGFAPSDLCGSSDPARTAHSDRCLACTTPAQALIPTVVCVLRAADVRLASSITAPRERKSVAAAHGPANWTRGPPLV